jgi:L-ascorbate metabolism protein UlaG (beta-lactamase superfamily)
MRLVEHPLPGSLPDLLGQPPTEVMSLVWLGQAGFVLDGSGHRVVIDPYLSDSLREKYRGTRFPHERRMPAPVAPEAIRHVTAVLATHAHTDHLDPGTLPALLKANPLAVLVAPASAAEVAAARAGIGSDRLRLVDAGDEIRFTSRLAVKATRAAHETLERDDHGRHRFLGFAVHVAGATVFHSGDTIPFEGQTEEVQALGADVALLPVNGRDETRRANGIPGNLTVEEAVTLARRAGIRSVIAHHFGLFDFNTIPRATVEAVAVAVTDLQLAPARIGVIYRLEQEAT